MKFLFFADNSGSSEGGNLDAEPVGNSMVDEQPANASEEPHPSAEDVAKSSVRQRGGEMFHKRVDAPQN